MYFAIPCNIKLANSCKQFVVLLSRGKFPLHYASKMSLVNSAIKNTRDSLLYSAVYLTNRFHVAVHLFCNRSQMTSKCGKNKKVAHELLGECVTEQMHGNMESVCLYNKETNQGHPTTIFGKISVRKTI